jgi:sulfhydrogenase subunit delta
MEVISVVDIVSFYMLSSTSSMEEKVDIAFVEGSISTEKDLLELRKIRKNAHILIAMGACAINGGVQSWAEGETTYEDLYEVVYGRDSIDFKGIQAQPISKYIDVNYFLPGCPPEEGEIVYFISTFLFRTYPEEKDYPVCHECRVVGNPCILIEKGDPCLGAITTAGCGARCIRFSVPCIGCRGSVPYNTAWFDSLAVIFKHHGFSEKYIRDRLAIFNTHDSTFNNRLNKAFNGAK